MPDISSKRKPTPSCLINAYPVPSSEFGTQREPLLWLNGQRFKTYNGPNGFYSDWWWNEPGVRINEAWTNKELTINPEDPE